MTACLHWVQAMVMGVGVSGPGTGSGKPEYGSCWPVTGNNRP
jgi:hypothetical protein